MAKNYDTFCRNGMNIFEMMNLKTNKQGIACWKY